jgi:hypothetical protein
VFARTAWSGLGDEHGAFHEERDLMPTLSRATLIRGSAVMVLASIFAIACTSSNPAVDAGPTQEVCPTNIVTATAHAQSDAGEGVSDLCHVQGYVCVVGFQCGNFTQQAACTCTLQSDKSLSFDCTLAANGMPVPVPTTDPTTLCTSIDEDATGVCPTSTATAMPGGMGAPCTESGQQCFYKGAMCSGDTVPGTDVCQCTGNFNGDAGLSWACDIGQCP